MKVFVTSLLALINLSSLWLVAEASEGYVHGRWQGAMGAAGLRRSLASDSDFGDLINRSTSYRAAVQADLARKRQQAAGAPLPDIQVDSGSDGWVLQSDSLAPLRVDGQGGLLLRAGLRRAERYEDERVDARSDRIELGLFRSTLPGYLGVSVIYEETTADLGFVEGNRDGDGVGIRLDTGRMINDTWAWSGRVEHVWWEGEGEVKVPSQTGMVRVGQDAAYERSYLNVDLIGHYGVSLPFTANAQLYWRSGIHHLQTRNEPQINSLGHPVQEAIGRVERLGMLRSGAQLSWRAGASQQWLPFGELIYDYEFSNNMDLLIDDPHTVTVKAGVARLLRPGWRAQLDVQRIQGLRGERVRNSATLALVFDW